jgi:hypothetical protein
VFSELREQILLLKQKGAAICDVGKHVGRYSQRIALPLADKPLGTRPTIVPRLLDEPSSNRVSQHVPHGGQQVVAFEREGVESTLKEVAAPAFPKRGGVKSCVRTSGR